MDLDYVDDICLPSNQQKKRAMLEVNIKSTKAIRINYVCTDNIILQGQRIHRSSYYLSSIMTINGGAKTNVNNRLNKARVTYELLQSIWRRSRMFRRIKHRIINAYIKWTVLYWSESWLVSNPLNKTIGIKQFRIVIVFWQIIQINLRK